MKLPERILFDLDNAPQVPAAIPIAEELEFRGHKVLFSVRNRSCAWDLMQQYKRPHIQYKDNFHHGMLAKITSTIYRAFSLSQHLRKLKITKTIGLGSRALPIASHFVGIPTITIIDYEWVNTTIYNKYSDLILIPEVINHTQCKIAGLNVAKVKHFPGIKQHIYINAKPDPERMIKALELNPNKTSILLRPPATTAHYSNKKTDHSFRNTLSTLLRDKEKELYCFPRHSNDIIDARVHTLRSLYNGIELISAFDAVVGAGGSMTREAAVLGIPSYTCFRGAKGKVDEYLIKENRLSETTDEFRLTLEKQPLFKLGRDVKSIIVDLVLQFV